jgi:hypothetical protein
MIYFAPRAMSETASALPLTFGMALILDESRWRRWFGGFLLGFAVLLRLQTGIVCIGALVMLALDRRWRHVLETSFALALCALGYGLLDKITWGTWFQSVVTYWNFNIVEGKGAMWGTEPWSYYLTTLWTSAPLLGWLLLILSLLAVRRAPALVLTALAFIAAHSIIPHKEFRFLVPIMPIVCASAAVGIEALESLRRKWADGVAYSLVTLLLMATVISTVRFHSLTFGDLGHYQKIKPRASAYDDFGPVNRLLLIAHDEKDLCGLKFEAVHPAWTGGITYLHRRVPLYSFDGLPARESQLFNYVITWPGAIPPSRVVARDGNFVLARVNDSCRPDPNYSWRLP